MKIPGKRIHKTRFIQTAKYVVAVDVELVYPKDDPSETCYEAETLHLLAKIQEKAESEDVEWLLKRGKVYRLVEKK